MKIEVRDVIKITLAVSAVLFFTGLAVVPFVNKVTQDAWQQNIMYAIGRVPVVFATIYVYLNLGDR
jgi:ethanolamine transporter EutH